MIENQRKLKNYEVASPSNTEDKLPTKVKQEDWHLTAHRNNRKPKTDNTFAFNDNVFYTFNDNVFWHLQNTEEKFHELRMCP